MHPSVRRSRRLSAALRLGLTTILVLGLIGAWLPSALAQDAGSEPAAQEEPVQTPRPARPVDEPTDEPTGGEGEQVQDQLETAEQPADEQPVDEQPTDEEEPAQPAPTPDPWGPTSVQLYDPALAQTVPTGAEATFILRVDHLGAGGPDAKEVSASVPAGWNVRFASAADGESLYDNDGDGWPETRPLFAGDWTYVAVTVTTPADLVATSSLSFRVIIGSFGNDLAAFQSWIDLSVTATVPDPTPAPTEELTPEPTVEPSPSSPSASPSSDDPTPEPSPSAGEAAPSGSSDEPRASPSGSAEPSASPSLVETVSESPSESASSTESTSASPSADESASPSASASGSPSPSASPSARDLRVVSITDDRSVELVPGETAEFRHGLAVEGLADDETATLAVRGTIDQTWPTILQTVGSDGPGVTAGGDDLLVTVTGSAPVEVAVRVTVPGDAAGGTTATLGVSARLLDGPPVDEVVGTGPADEGEANLAVTASEARAQSSDAVPETSATYSLSVESMAALTVEGDVQFGQVRFDGRVDPAVVSDVTATTDDLGATYTRAHAIALDVSGLSGPWTISCQAVGSDLSGFEWRANDGPWRRFVASDGQCLSGEGPTDISIDVRFRVNWGDPTGSIMADLTFTLTDSGDGPARPLAG